MAVYRKLKNGIMRGYIQYTVPEFGGKDSARGLQNVDLVLQGDAITLMKIINLVADRVQHIQTERD